MPTLEKHQSNEYTKLLMLGDSGSGKTGALASLVAANYKLRILDMDNGLETLKQYVLKECPEKVKNVEYRTLRDKRKASPGGPIIDGTPKAFIEAIRMLDRWRYVDGENEIDLGIPAQWGPDVIFVIDSLTFLSDAAFDFREPLTPKSKTTGQFDARAVYKDAQDAIEGVLALITSEAFRTNVIVNAHVKYIDNDDGSKKGYPTAVGSALSPQIPRYFNTVALFQTKAGGKRTLHTAATAMIDLKNPKPFEMAKEYPIETGLADLFKVLREPPQQQEEPTPTSTPKSQPTSKPKLIKSLRR
jgi:hypothetical protein